MTPMDVDDSLQQEVDKLKAQEQFKTTIKQFIEKTGKCHVKIKFREGNIALEYRIMNRFRFEAWPFYNLSTRGLIIQILTNIREYDYELVVFNLKHRDLAEKLAAHLTLVYGAEKIKLTTSRYLKPINESFDL